MSKKIDLSKLLTKGSAKQRASLLIYHYTILEVIDLYKGKDLKPILTDQEAKAIFDSFKDNREIKIYNDYRDLHNKMLHSLKLFQHTGLTFERDYYKYLYMAEVFKKTGDKDRKNEYYTIAESVLIDSYTKVVNFYHAIKIYAKERGYTNKYIQTAIEEYLKYIQDVYDTYSVEMNNGESMQMKLSDIEPNYMDISQVLYEDFNMDNSQILKEYFNNTDEKEPE